MATQGPDRNLLFGILALHNGFIRRDDLVRAMSARVAEKETPLGAILVRQGDLAPDHHALMEALVRAHLTRHHDDPAASLAGLNTSAEVGALVDDFAGDGVCLSQATRTTARADGAGALTSAGLRFRILRAHAEGGLGAVFLARDEELNREVALKQIKERFCNDVDCRTRFVAEAEITGGLEHPGVVPVYGLGRDSSDRPYYAMRFIKGESLKEAVDQFRRGVGGGARERALGLRKLLGRFVDVCDAIAYAHSRGVVHRDIKPSNVMLGRFGETLVVDWGLAKAVGRDDVATPLNFGEATLRPSSGGGSATTLPGAPMGTPAFMSPEQATGRPDDVGPASDVYGLGATLYYLLAGAAPFAGSDVERVLGEARRGDFPAPRRVDASVAPALEAVCLKAMARFPGDRYPSARALADDVERWLADEAVSAYRDGPLARLGRWSRRHRSAVTAAAAAVLVALAGLSAVSAVQTRANAKLVDANARVSRANDQLRAANERVRQRFDLALDAIKLFHGEVSQDLLLKEEKFDRLRTRLLRGAADFYGKLEALLKPQQDRESRAALGLAYDELGRLTDQIDNKAEALAVHRKALAVRRELASAPGPGQAGARLDVARSLIAAGDLQSDTGDTAGALAAYEEARALAEALGPADPARGTLALAYQRRSVLLSETGQPAAGLASFERSRAIRQELADANPGAAAYQSDLQISHQNLGNLLSLIGRPAEALASLEKGLAIGRKLVDANPGVADYQYDLAIGHRGIGVVLSQTGKPAEALASFERARAIVQKLVDANPGVTAYQRELAVEHNNAGVMLEAAGRPAEALASYEKARALRRKLADANPRDKWFRSELAGADNNIGHLLSKTGRPAEALAAYETARAARQALADANPDVTIFQYNLALTHNRIGALLREAGRPAEALAAYETARAIGQKLADSSPALADPRSELAATHVGIGLLLSAAGRPAEALASFERARAIHQGLADANPANTGYQSDLGVSHTNIGLVLAKLGRPAEALASHEKARALRQKLADANPGVAEFQRDLANDLASLGRSHLGAGRPAEALALLCRAVAALDRLPPLPGDLYDQACYRSLLAAAAAAAAAAGEPGSGVSADQAGAEAGRAMAALARAVAAGYRDVAHMRTDADLDALRPRRDFQLLMLDLEMPPDPFAR